MNEPWFYAALLRIFFAAAALVVPLLFVITPAYGRHVGQSHGRKIDSTLGWVIMEVPSVVVFLLCVAVSERAVSTACIVFLVMWQTHYVHRCFIYPWRRRQHGSERRMAVYVVAAGTAFTCVNAYLNGRYLFAFAPPVQYGAAWLTDPRFVCGVVLFLTGFAINLHADAILLALRRAGPNGYGIAYGGLYRWVTCPNYLGEIIEWTGWAVMTWSLPGLAFALWTAANLVPRALSHQRWYHVRFAEYPRERRAIVPFVL